jgi:hypothetical protein
MEALSGHSLVVLTEINKSSHSKEQSLVEGLAVFKPEVFKRKTFKYLTISR